MSTRRYRALPDVVRLSLGADRVLVESPLGDRAQIVDRRAALLLGACRAPDTLAGHAARLGPEARADIERLLEDLVERGLLVAEPFGMGGPTERPAVPAIAGIGIPTRGRSELLVRAIQSYAQGIEITVADDARSADEAAALAQLPVAYAGVDERRRYAKLLAARAEVPEDIAQFALVCSDGVGTGSVRNALLLQYAGELSVQVDDDTLALGAPTPEPRDGIDLFSRRVPTELYFPAPGSTADSLVDLAPSDVRTVHGELLGRGARECLADRIVDASSASGELLSRLDGTVVMTQPGIVGDAASESLTGHLLLHGASRDRLLASEAVYCHALGSRQLVRARRRPAIGQGASCVALSLGLDARRLLPPFPPRGRNAEAVFAMAIERCIPRALMGYSPWVVAHRPPARSGSPAVLARPRANDLLAWLAAESGIAGGDARESLRALGAFLEWLGTLADFAARARATTLRMRARELVTMRRTLERYREPDYWVHDVERSAAALENALLDPELGTPRDLPIDAMRQHTARYGALLRAWPELFEAALDLRREGIRPAT